MEDGKQSEAERQAQAGMEARGGTTLARELLLEAARRRPRDALRAPRGRAVHVARPVRAHRRRVSRSCSSPRSRSTRGTSRPTPARRSSCTTPPGAEEDPRTAARLCVVGRVAPRRRGGRSGRPLAATSRGTPRRAGSSSSTSRSTCSRLRRPTSSAGSRRQGGSTATSCGGPSPPRELVTRLGLSDPWGSLTRPRAPETSPDHGALRGCGPGPRLQPAGRTESRRHLHATPTGATACT